MANRVATPPAALASALQRSAPALEQVERTLREAISGDQPLIGAVGEHVLSSGGKRLRPLLVMLAAELCGYDGPRRVQIAAAIELLHTATLLHDDVVDLATLRRGKEAARAIWGNRRAVLVGDYFYARASSMIVEDGNMDILSIFADTIRRMSEGELMQLERSFDPEVTEAHYYGVIERKSASLIAAAAEAGAILAGVTRAERRRLSSYGREFGLAFQLRDDALDFAGAEAELGKRPYTDVREGKVTLPLLLTLKRATAAERDAIGALLKTAARRSAELQAEGIVAVEQVLSARELTPVIELVERHHGIADTNRRAREHVARAAEAIAPFPDGPSKNALLAAADYSVGRET
jgi:octaprenyl-diphosphate synthase